MKMYPYFLTSLVMILVIAVSIMILMLSFQGGTGKLMELNISGGFAGMNMNFEYYSNGSIVFNDLRRNLRNSVLVPRRIMDELMSRIDLLLDAYPDGLELKPEGGADYFIYSLSVYGNGRKITYWWTDMSENPKELVYLVDLLRKTNALASGSGELILYVKTDKLKVERGEALKIFIMVINPLERDFQYPSPTPCSPDFKAYLYAQENRVTELFPID
ncbi:MAG: hypothetical protein ACUVQY_06320 [Thermoproteota archaeon]